MGDIAARPQEILAGLSRCEYCGFVYPLHSVSCRYNEFIPKGVKMSENETKSTFDPEIKKLRDVGYHVLTDEDLKRYCDNARAYGWEAGKRDHSNLTGTGRLQAMYTSGRGNPFVDPNWDAHLKTEDGQGFIVTAKDNQL